MMMCSWRVTFLDNRLIRPDYWCCCYLQTPTILRHRRPERSETANSSPGSSPARLAVLCMWTQSTPGCESGCMWPSKWLWACPSNCQEKGTTSSDFSAIINIRTASYFMTSQILTCHFWIEMSLPRHVVLWFWPHIWETKHTIMSVVFKTRSEIPSAFTLVCKVCCFCTALRGV